LSLISWYAAERFANEIVQKLLPFDLVMTGSLRRKQSVDCLEFVAPDLHEFDSLAYRLLRLTSTPDSNPLTAELSNKFPIRIWKAKPAYWGSTLLLTTGTSEFTTTVQEFAKFKGFRLDAKGLFRDNIYLAGWDEESIFTILNLHFLNPEERLGKSAVKKIFRPYEWEIPSNTDPTQTYWVRWDSPDYWNCECPGFQYRQDCSHIHYMILHLGFRRQR